MYKYIHSLHHRNTDIEPFSGLSMHPIEHLYYFSCLGPSFLLYTTPFAFMYYIYVELQKHLRHNQNTMLCYAKLLWLCAGGTESIF